MDSRLSEETIKRLIAQQQWIQNSLIVSFLLSLLVGFVSVSINFSILNLLDTLIMPMLIATRGAKQVKQSISTVTKYLVATQAYFVGYPFKRLLSYVLTLYVFGKLVTLACCLMRVDTYFGMGAFIIAHVVYFTGEFLFVLYCHYLELTWDSKIKGRS